MIGTELDFPIKSNTLKHGNEQLTSSLYSYDTRHVRVIKAQQDWQIILYSTYIIKRNFYVLYSFSDSEEVKLHKN